MVTFQLFFQSREQVVVRRGQIRRIGWMIKTLEAHVSQFLLGCKCPVSRGIVVQEQNPVGELTAAFFLQNVLQLHQQRWVILHVESLALWKIINEKDAVLITKKSRRELFQRIFALGIFWGGVSRYVATPLIVVLSLGHGDITRFRPWPPIATDRKSFGSRQKNSKSFSDDWHRWRFLSAFRHFGTHFTESFLMSKSSWMTDPTHSREIPSFSAINLAEVRRSSKIISWIWSVISGVVTVLSRPERDASHVEKSPRLTWATQFLMVAYDGACSPNVCVRMACISFGALPCRGGGELYESSRLDVVETARVAWNASFQPL